MNIQRCSHPLVESIFSARQIPLEGGGSTPLNVYIPREQGDYLYSLVRHYRPRVTVEIGLANGISALFITAAHHDNGIDGLHIAIDPFQQCDWKDVGVGLIRQAGHNLRLIGEPSSHGLPRLEQEGVIAGLIFIDGAHLTDYVFTDFVGSDRILGIGGLMVFDDSDWDAVQPVIRFAITNREYRPAHPEVVIEPPPGSPGIVSRTLRSVGSRFSYLGNKLTTDFLYPSAELGILGRCVTLCKTSDDRRNSQDRVSHRRF